MGVGGHQLTFFVPCLVVTVSVKSMKQKKWIQGAVAHWHNVTYKESDMGIGSTRICTQKPDASK